LTKARPTCAYSRLEVVPTTNEPIDKREDDIDKREDAMSKERRRTSRGVLSCPGIFNLQLAV
jgi:hypothetical protein